MRTFFYSIQASDCARDCDWQNCPERYYSQLKAANQEYDFSKIEDMVYTKVQFYPRWGDVIILFVSTQKDMEQILCQKELFEGLKKIIVVADPNSISAGECHKLRPSFITSTCRDIHEITAVIERINEKRLLKHNKGA